MKKTSLTVLAMLFAVCGYSQNTYPYPENADVGIGTNTPSEKLEVNGNIKWSGFNSGNARALKIGYSGGNYGGIGYNIDFTPTTGIFNRPLSDQSSYLEFWHGGFKFYGTHDATAVNGVHLNGGASNLNHFATINNIGNFGLGTAPLNGGGASKWLTIDGSVYSGGVIYSVNGIPKGYSYYADAANGLVYQATTGIPISFQPNGITSLKLNTDGSSVFSGTLTGESALFNSKVGVGIITPYSQSRIHIKSISASPWGILSEAVNNDRVIGISHTGNEGVIASSYLQGSGYTPLQFWTENLPRMTIATNGNVGIGTTTPDSKLTVAGKIHSQEVKVTVSAGADFVFQKDYNLKPLTELAEYISEHQHLPEIASADEMKKNGLELGEMNIKLLQKIEELTLHLIEKDKELANEKMTNQSQQRQIDSLIKRFETLEKK